ncbi:hypothetical protein Q8F55_009305 [Vanrija albida]|uniref:F-box domain-containing protein n=1 Tax=Vanrija albida TaxID=181172 RepID=A0ABR3PT98_9TREE
MSIADPDSHPEVPSRVPPRGPVLCPSALPHIFRQILEDPANYWDLHDLRGVCRGFRDVIDEIQCTHLVVCMRETILASSKVYWDDIWMFFELQGKATRMSFPYKEYVDAEGLPQYRGQEAHLPLHGSSIDMITCRVRYQANKHVDPDSDYCFHIPCLRALWEDDWDSDTWQHALGLIRKNTKTVLFINHGRRNEHRPRNENDGDRTRSAKVRRSQIAPDRLMSQVVVALASNPRYVRGDRSWFVNAIPRHHAGWCDSERTDLWDYRRMRVGGRWLSPALHANALLGAWVFIRGQFTNRWRSNTPRFRPSEDYPTATHIVQLFYAEPSPMPVDIYGLGLEGLLEAIARWPMVKWVVVGDEQLLDKLWIGQYAPGSAPVQERIQNAVATYSRHERQYGSKLAHPHDPDVLAARLQAIRFIPTAEYECRVNRETPFPEDFNNLPSFVIGHSAESNRFPFLWGSNLPPFQWGEYQWRKKQRAEGALLL